MEKQETSSPPRAAAPPSLVFDHNIDSGAVLWRRLRERSQVESGVRLIVHLKNGATHVGSLLYYDAAAIVIGCRGRELEFWLRDLAHVLAVPEAVGALASAVDGRPARGDREVSAD